MLAEEIVSLNRKTATTTVTVTVTNENDNDPVFTANEYSGSVAENAGPGQFITQVCQLQFNYSYHGDILLLQVVAVDDDKGTFGIVYYTLVNGFGKFKINSTTGIITTTDSIDYEDEDTQRFSLTVKANDSAVYPIPQK